jgi:hypothetical protein
MRMNIDLPESVTDLSRDVYEWPAKLDAELLAAEEKHGVERARLEEKLREKRFTFDLRSQVHADELE